MVDLQLSLLICHSGWNGNVEGDEDFPWCEQPTSFCLSHYWACADTAVWIYNLRKAVHLWFVSPLQLENSTPAVVVARIRMVGLLNSLYVQHVLYCMLCFSLINYALLSLQISKELSLEWNFTLMIIHLFQRPTLTKRLLRTADAHCRHQTSEKPCPLTSCALPSTYSMYPWCPWQQNDQMKRWLWVSSRTMNISIKTPWPVNWLHLSFSSPGHPNMAEPASLWSSSIYINLQCSLWKMS